MAWELSDRIKMNWNFSRSFIICISFANEKQSLNLLTKFIVRQRQGSNSVKVALLKKKEYKEKDKSSPSIGFPIQMS